MTSSKRFGNRCGGTSTQHFKGDEHDRDQLVEMEQGCIKRRLDDACGVGACAAAPAASIGKRDIGGVVTSKNGPEAGVWGIAETTGLPTKFAKMVVTDDQGRYVLPELPNAIYKDTPLCMSLLDIDNFKKLNDSLGYDAGDEALTHLVGVTRECTRSQDTLARYGGEEFVILMPDTTLDKDIHVMTRLQRALTRRFFLAGSGKMLITFSAGVAQLAQDKSGQEAIKRADQAMYLAKCAGKNRVLGA